MKTRAAFSCTPLVRRTNWLVRRFVGRWVIANRSHRFRFASLLCCCAVLAGCGGSSSPSTGGGGASAAKSNTQAGNITVSNTDGTLVACSVDNTGSIGTCQFSKNPGLNQPGSMGVAGSSVFFGNLANNTLSACTLSNGLVSSCATPDLSQHLKGPLGIAAANGQLYITNSDNRISVCALSQTSEIGACQSSPAGGTLSDPQEIAIWKQFVYVANEGNNSVSVCTADSSGNLSGCTSQTANGAFNAPSGIAASNGYLYVGNLADDSISSCPIGATGSIGNCGKLVDAENISMPTSLSFNGSVAYITNFGTNTIAECAVQADGSLSACSAGSAGDAFSFPASVVFTPAGN